MNCLECARCCKVFSFELGGDGEWVNKFLEFLFFTRPEIFERDGKALKIKIPCKYLNLENNKCTIYENRPQMCRDFICNRMRGE